jgi:hypothetical protein
MRQPQLRCMPARNRMVIVHSRSFEPVFLMSGMGRELTGCFPPPARWWPTS